MLSLSLPRALSREWGALLSLCCHQVLLFTQVREGSVTGLSCLSNGEIWFRQHSSIVAHESTKTRIKTFCIFRWAKPLTNGNQHPVTFKCNSCTHYSNETSSTLLMWQQCSGPWCIPFENGNFWVLSLNFQVRFSTHGSILLGTWVSLVMLLHKASYNLHQRARIPAVVFSWMIGIATQTKPTHQPWYRRISQNQKQSRAKRFQKLSCTTGQINT